MKSLSLLLAVSLFATAGCALEPDDKPGKSFCESGCEEPNNNEPNNNEPNNNETPIPGERPELKGVFVSGHLGSYWDCPEDAYHGEAPSPGADGDFAPGADGACMEGSECPSFEACEQAQVTIALSNGGAAQAREILVEQIELFGTDGVSRAILPLISTIDTATNAPFDGTLAAGESVTLRVEFQGPYDPYGLLAPVDGAAGDRAIGGGGIVETTFSADNHDDVVVESAEIYDVPAIDT